MPHLGTHAGYFVLAVCIRAGSLLVCSLHTDLSDGPFKESHTCTHAGMWTITRDMTSGLIKKLS